MRIGTGVFRGAIKAIEPNRLGEEHAVEAVNCDLRTGALAPLKGKTDEWTAPEGTERVHLWGGKVACFTQKDVSVLKHPNNDNIVWAGTDYGQHPLQASETQFFDEEEVSLPLESSRFGVDTPPQAPTVVVGGEAEEEAKLTRSTAYRFSAVAETGEESGLSLPSDVMDVFAGQTAKITQFWPVEDDEPQIPEGVDKLRVYRVETDQYGTPAWMFVAELPVDTADFEDNVEMTEEVAQTDGHLPPVDFEGLADLGNGIMVGWKERDLFLSEVGYPTAFPLKYKLRTNAAIVGVGVTGGFGVVLTTGRPYLLSATTPEAATFPELQFAAPCLSARSICASNLGVIYASTDGLMMISSGGVPTILTEGVLTKEQWQALSPENMICAVQDGKVYGFRYGTNAGWVYDIARQDVGDIVLPASVSDAHVDEQGDRLLILDGDESVGDLGAGDDLVCRWKSGLWLFATAMTFSVARIIGNQSAEHPVTLKVWRNGVLHFTKTGIIDRRPFMLPPGLFLSAQYELSGSARVLAAHLASDIDELGR